MLFYHKLVSELKERGFKINEYDPCVATKMVNDEQMTITWHVDDLKISHMDREVVGEVVDMEEEGVRAMGDVPSCMNKVSKKITINYHVTF